MNDSIDLNLKKALVRKQACFFQLTDAEIEDLANLLVEKQVVSGEIIVSEGDFVDSVYLIVEGLADVRNSYVKDNAVHFKSVATLSAGESIGLNETGFYSLSGRRTATVVASCNMILLRLSIAEFHGYALSNSHVSEVMRKNAVAYTEEKLE